MLDFPAGSVQIFSATRRDATYIGRIITTFVEIELGGELEHRRGREALAVALRIDRPQRLDPGRSPTSVRRPTRPR